MQNAWCVPARCPVPAFLTPRTASSSPASIPTVSTVHVVKPPGLPTRRPASTPAALVRLGQGLLAIEDIRRRVAQFVELGLPVVVTRAPLFTNKADLMARSRFVVGYDTAARLVLPKYYGNSYMQMVLDFARCVCVGRSWDEMPRGSAPRSLTGKVRRGVWEAIRQDAKMWNEFSTVWLKQEGPDHQRSDHLPRNIIARPEIERWSFRQPSDRRGRDIGPEGSRLEGGEAPASAPRSEPAEGYRTKNVNLGTMSSSWSFES
jgi:hypothetical protein